MVCMDGFILTHAVEEVELPEQHVVDDFLPPFEPRQVLDPAEPVSIGAMVGPEAFMEVRYLAHQRQMDALDLIPHIAGEYGEATGRLRNGLISEYRLEDADVVVVALGSVLGTLQDTVDALRENGVRAGVLGITSFRPFPLDAVRAAIGHVPSVIVLEKALAVGIGGIVTNNIRTALAGMATPVRTVIAGLGGRPILQESLARMVESVDELDELSFLDLRTDLVDREIERTRLSRRSGPTAENLLRDVGAVGDPHGVRTPR
jgi:pyruvate ferredoxin oxidoreductase alpha subunit